MTPWSPAASRSQARGNLARRPGDLVLFPALPRARHTKGMKRTVDRVDASTSATDPPLRDEEVEVAAGPVVVAGHLTIPEAPKRHRRLRSRQWQQ